MQFTLKQDAAGRFGNFTQTNIGRPMAIVLDNRVMSVATIQGRITDSGQITGINRDEMIDTVITLKSGALPATMEYLEERTVGPTLGQDSIRAGVTAAVGGLVLVVVFMLFYYKLAGLNALTSIVVNLVLLLGMMSYLGATMTLPGIAGFILTIGMGVDSNVLIFERIKEELATARGVRAAVERGLRPGVVDDRRHARRVADRGRVPVPVRHRADSRLCHESGHRARVQRVHGGLRVADHVRNRADAPPRRNPEYLSVRLCAF